MADGRVETGPGADGARAEIVNAWKARPLRKGADENRLDAILGRKILARTGAAPAARRAGTGTITDCPAIRLVNVIDLYAESTVIDDFFDGASIAIAWKLGAGVR